MTTIVGVDFGAPQRGRDQRRKIIAIAAQATDWRRYRIAATGMNERLLAKDPPGWGAKELLGELLSRPVRIAAFDFPFCVPDVLLRDEKFATDAGHEHGAFISWRTFNAFVAERLPIVDPLDFRPFEAWRTRANRARLWVKRGTDIVADGQPPLKDKFQATFQMTLLGNALLSRLWESHLYRVLPFPGGRGTGEVIEVYPGATLRQMGLFNYKSRPDEAMRLGIAACAAADIKLDIDLRLMALCCRYSSGARAPDYDGADAFVALCTAILHAEGACRAAFEWGPVAEECRGRDLGAQHVVRPGLASDVLLAKTRGQRCHHRSPWVRRLPKSPRARVPGPPVRGRGVPQTPPPGPPIVLTAPTRASRRRHWMKAGG